jgi:hypothetical protein
MSRSPHSPVGPAPGLTIQKTPRGGPRVEAAAGYWQGFGPADRSQARDPWLPRTCRLPPGKPAEHSALRGLPGLRVEALAGRRRTRALSGPVRVGWAAARRELRQGAMARARAGIGTGLDPLRGAIGTAPRRAAGRAAGTGGLRGRCGSLVAPGCRHDLVLWVPDRRCRRGSFIGRTVRGGTSATGAGISGRDHAVGRERTDLARRRDVTTRFPTARTAVTPGSAAGS